MTENSKLLVCIAFHNNPKRLGFIEKVIENFSKYKVIVDIVVDTNETLDLKASVVEHRLNHPYHLTWVHRNHFKRNIDNYDYFMYVEDDMLVPYEGFCEYLNNFSVVWDLGYVPSFIRIETMDDKEFITDVTTEQTLEPIIIENKKFVTFQHPTHYHAFWIMPQKQLKETLTENFERVETSREMAASYPMWELNKTPIVKIEENQIDKLCYSYHLPNNYATNPNTKFGKIEVKNVLKIKK
jgi:uncharacterized protein YkvS